MRADARLPDRRFLYREEGLFFVICSFGAKITTLLEHFMKLSASVQYSKRR